MVVLQALAWSLGLYWACLSLLGSDLRDPDLWWHLASGRAIVEGKTLLSQDIFSHTQWGHPWINFEWLSQTIFYAIALHFDLRGLYIARFLLSLCSLICLILCLRKVKAPNALSLFLFLIGVYVLRPRLACRPELFSMVLFPVFIWISLFVFTSPTRHFYRRLHILIAGLMLLWVNLHGAFIYGPAIFFLFAVGARWNNFSMEKTRFFVRAGFVSLVMMFINPRGIKLGEIFWDHAQQFLFHSHKTITEWTVTTVHGNPAFWGLYAVCLIAMGWAFISKKTSLYWIPLLAVFLLWGTIFNRNAALVGFIAIPFLGELGFAFHHFKKTRLPNIFIAIGWLAAVSPVLADITVFQNHIPDDWVDSRWTPVGACQFLKNNRVEGKMFNTYHYGGYISWILGPQIKVFWDGRYIFHPMTLEFTEVNKNFFATPQEFSWAPYFDRYGITLSVVAPTQYKAIDPGSSVGLSDIEAMFPRKNWALVYWDDAAFVFVKRMRQYDALIQRYEYKWAYPENIDRLHQQLKAHQIPLAQLQAELMRHQKDVGFTLWGQIQQQLLQ